MKNILCYGDSNTWGQIAGDFDPTLMIHGRYTHQIRWTCVLQKLLGPDYYVIEAGLNGRNSSFDEIGTVRPSRNGLATLPGILEMHYPLDLVVVMLGTNDLKIQCNATIPRIIDGMRQLIHCIKTSKFGRNYQAPSILLMAPVPLHQIAAQIFKLNMDEHSVTKSHQLAHYYEQLAETEKCIFLDAKAFATIDLNDGVHITDKSHYKLAAALATKIKTSI